MKKLAAIFGLILAATAFSFADAKFGYGLCPDLTNEVPYSPDMKKISGIRFHYLDKLMFNLYALINMFGV
jgi:hypothetical protein